MARKKTTKNPGTNICVICGKHYIGFGNNAFPVKEGRCCDACNFNRVIPARMASIRIKEN